MNKIQAISFPHTEQTPPQYKTQNWPKISIVTPSFNQADYLEATILSILNQNYPNLEYIIIDGGSTDNSVEIIKKYADKLTFWVSEPDNGLYDAVQKGFKQSTGDVMAWLNSDDLYHPNALKTVAEIFNSFADIQWMTTTPTAFDETGRTVNVTDSLKIKWSKFRFYAGDFRWIQQESTFWRRSLWQKAGERMAVNLRFAGDFELWLRFFRYEKLYFISTLTGGFRLRSTKQLSFDNMDAYLVEVHDCLKAERVNLSRLDKIKMRLLKLDKLLRLLPKIRNIYEKSRISETHFEFTPDIIFNRITQTFTFKAK